MADTSAARIIVRVRKLIIGGRGLVLITTGRYRALHWYADGRFTNVLKIINRRIRWFA